MRIVLSPLAAEDLAGIHAHVLEFSPPAAAQLLLRITRTIERLASGWMKGRSVVLRGGRRVGTWSVPPYRIYYRSAKDEFQVIRIYHQARRPIERRRRK